MADEPMNTWRKITICAVFGGIGLAIGTAVIIGGVIWYSNRPAPPPQWDSKSLKATYAELEFTQPPDLNSYTINFAYNVQNNSKQTYEINTTAITPMAVLTNGKALSKQFGFYQSGDATLDAPPFVPQRGTARIVVNVTFSFAPDFSQADKNDVHKVIHNMDTKLRGIGGITLFDATNHYEIDLPNGWANDLGVKAGTQPYIDGSLAKKKTSANDLPPCPSNDPIGLYSKSNCAPPPSK